MNLTVNEVLLNQATRWYARLRAPDCSTAERHEFQQWLNADVGHARAYENVVRTADRITQQVQMDSRLRALADRALANGVDGALTEAAPSQSRQLSGRCVAALKNHWRAAAVVLLSIGAATLFAGFFNEPTTGVSTVSSYANSEMREQRIELDDGSLLYLDVDSEVSVEMTAGERRLKLQKGRAYFEVAHDKSRPFSVTAADTRTVALGTRFEVAMSAQSVNVTLAEGSVAVSDASVSGRWREVLTPGQQLQVAAGSARREKITVNTNTIASWSNGRLVFDGMPLSKVLEEINRYASVKVHLGDSALANIPIGGNFVAGGDSGEFVETLTAMLPLRSVRTGTNEIVLFQRYETPRP